MTPIRPYHQANLVTVSEVARQLELSHQQVETLAKNGEIKSFAVSNISGTRSKIMLDLEHALEHAEELREKANKNRRQAHEAHNNWLKGAKERHELTDKTLQLIETNIANIQSQVGNINQVMYECQQTLHECQNEIKALNEQYASIRQSISELKKLWE